MVSKVFMICDAYESGFGHGLAQDGLDLSKTPHGNPEHGEAYQLGYEAGMKRAQLAVAHVTAPAQDERKPVQDDICDACTDAYKCMFACRCKLHGVLMRNLLLPR